MAFNQDEAYALLHTHFRDRVRRNEPLAQYSPLGIGGPADLWILLNSMEELVQLVNTCAEEHYPVLIIGNGSNVLFSDAGVRGIVAKVATHSYTVENLGNGRGLLIADAGITWPRLAYELAELGWGGLEFGADIPGTLGGGIVSNAGAHNEDVGQHLQWLEVLDARGANADGEDTIAYPMVRRYEHDELDLSNRHSRFRVQRCASFDEDGHLMPSLHTMIEPGEIILRLALTLYRDDPEHLHRRLKQYTTMHEQLRPCHAGPLFKNPFGQDVSHLIERAGMRGRVLGNVQVSSADANYLVNLGSAHATDVIALLTLIHRRVLEQMHIDLAVDLELQGDWEAMGDREQFVGTVENA
ncbi:UDP-N-acetylenolpyruvoylglucosamine reductase [Reticulibacter mediterranei]|uniref:UDP-N-acetylenolpyruvoylglucosamine reductase n=1 Tax=Reticulibacter mediterranei TaxID=2778369 RepID=A0A8J3IP96_9CHLR|nr:FAD-binding protein [Reticulibacter mediterranei]GHO96043.1 UDP-N-acetylenolpyruvoylglucosamine reductase [Reticulibacter mediterranei]